MSEASNRRQELFDLARQVKNYLNYLKSLGLMNLPQTRLALLDDSIINSFKETLEDIRDELGSCTQCQLSSSRKRIVFGEGHPRANLMFIGDFPKKTDEIEGKPFSGKDGSLLTDIIEKGLEILRGDCYITTAVKCRTPDDRRPELNEIRACLPFLFRQVMAVRPRVICVLGESASQGLLNRPESLAELRHRFHDLFGFPAMPTFHPEYLNRHPEKKREAWEDIKIIKRRLHS